MKLGGAVLVLLGCALAGRQYALSRRGELRCLGALCEALQRMEAELSARGLPLPELIALLARETAAPASAYFAQLSGRLSDLGERSFHDLWRETAKDSLSPLSPAEREAFCALGAALGRYPLEEQKAAIRRCRERLAARRDTSQRRLRDDLRLCWGLSACLGFLLWILLI